MLLFQNSALQRLRDRIRELEEQGAGVFSEEEQEQQEGEAEVIILSEDEEVAPTQTFPETPEQHDVPSSPAEEEEAVATDL
jgi:hypothetical protein